MNAWPQSDSIGVFNNPGAVHTCIVFALIRMNDRDTHQRQLDPGLQILCGIPSRLTFVPSTREYRATPHLRGLGRQMPRPPFSRTPPCPRRVSFSFSHRSLPAQARASRQQTADNATQSESSTAVKLFPDPFNTEQCIVQLQSLNAQLSEKFRDRERGTMQLQMILEL